MSKKKDKMRIILCIKILCIIKILNSIEENCLVLIIMGFDNLIFEYIMMIIQNDSLKGSQNFLSSSKTAFCDEYLGSFR